jgi:hypothetical protein
MSNPFEKQVQFWTTQVMATRRNAAYPPTGQPATGVSSSVYEPAVGGPYTSPYSMPFLIRPAASQPALGGPAGSAQVDLAEQVKKDKLMYMREAFRQGLDNDAAKKYVESKMQPAVAPQPAPQKEEKIMPSGQEENTVYLKAKLLATEMGMDEADAEEFACEQLIEYRKSQLDKKRAASPTMDDGQKKAKTDAPATGDQAGGAGDPDPLTSRQDEFLTLARTLRNESNALKKNKTWVEGCKKIDATSVISSGGSLKVDTMRQLVSVHKDVWGYPAFALESNFKPWVAPDDAQKAAYGAFLEALNLDKNYVEA